MEMDWTRSAARKRRSSLGRVERGRTRSWRGQDHPRQDSTVLLEGLAGATEEREGEHRQKRASSRAIGECAIPCLSEPQGSLVGNQS